MCHIVTHFPFVSWVHYRLRRPVVVLLEDTLIHSVGLMISVLAV
jgi:hypothetical protein